VSGSSGAGSRKSITTRSGGCGSGGLKSPEARNRRRAFGELLIDLEEEKASRAVVFGLLREMERK
jgi:hypothetical protein